MFDKEKSGRCYYVCNKCGKPYSRKVGSWKPHPLFDRYCKKCGDDVLKKQCKKS